MSAGDCPKGGDHNWRNTRETATHVTHTCTKCGQTYTRQKSSRLFAALMLAILVACTLCIIWAGAPTT